MLRRICVVTGTRAEYGLFLPILRGIKASKDLTLQLIATTMHSSEEFGFTYQQIEQDGFVIDEKIENLLAADSKQAKAKSSGLATILLSDVYSRLRPDVILLLGDRFETHAAATTAMLMNIPIAHIHGGEVTEGAIDEKIRHSITKMAQIHFTSTERYRERVIQLGEEPKNVFCTGAPGIDNVQNTLLLEKEALEKKLQWKISEPFALFTFHPETLSDFDPELRIQAILKVLDHSSINILFTYANADDGGRIINKNIEQLVATNTKKYHVVKSLGQLKYLSAMKLANLIIGNSSSGIIEGASFKKPVINIGNRQTGRLQSGNVINVDPNQLSFAIKKALSDEFLFLCSKKINVYGVGDAAQKIVHILKNHDLNCIKRFHDL
jgi:UDP-hydrolysing UDP-N-acetyl-D-glucosamine 2-epimerase